MNDPPFELNTTISNLKNLDESDLTPYDAVYLGNIYCRLYERNFLEQLDDLREGIRRVQAAGRKAYVTTYAAPRNSFLPKIRKVLEAAASVPADAVEVHNLGVLRMAHEEFPELKVHIGGLANVYTDAGALVLKQYGAQRVTPNYELSLEEINELTRAAELPAEILVHGKMPLGISDHCFLLDYEEKWGIQCPTLCQLPLFVKKDGWAMRSAGKGIMSGKDVCMLEHLPALLRSGHRVFRIEAAYESAAYRQEIARTYREALEVALSGQPFRLEERWWEVIRGHARIGLCNGFYFGRTGMDYLDASSPAIASFLGREVPAD
jgi:U32 family peptidase